MSAYKKVYEQWSADPNDFWAAAARDVHWFEEPQAVLNDSNPPFYRWFDGGLVNSCYNALDRHLDEGRAEQTALIYDSPVTNTVRRYSYRELRDETARLAGVLHKMGVEKGDRVIIYMPMVPEAVIGMLACARIGAIHSVVFGGFAPRELATRIDDAKPRVVLSASCGIEINRVLPYKPLLDEAIEIATHKPKSCLILQRPEAEAEMIDGRDLDWAEEVDDADPIDCVPLEASHPLYILYTSGTTGMPKGVVRDNGGHLVALKWSMKNIYGVDPGDVFWAASDVGWVVGHSYIVYGPLFHGCTTVLYEGKPVGTPDAGAFWRVIADHDVNVLFTAPTAFRAIKREDPEAVLLKNFALKDFRALFLAGERCDPATLLWAQEKLDVPIVDHWWQTETGWPVSANPLGIELLPVKPGSATVPMPGYDVRILNGLTGEEVDTDEIGDIAIKLPLPPGTLMTLWQNDDRYVKSYLNKHPGYYLTADAGFIDQDGYVSIMSRTDDIINVAGHRLSTGAIEGVIAGHPDIAECAVIGVKDELKGEVPVSFLVLKSGVERPVEEIIKESIQLVRQKIGPVVSYKIGMVVKRLPKTRSGKVLRGTMKMIADGQKWKMPATIDDPLILDEITDALGDLGYGSEAEES